MHSSTTLLWIVLVWITIPISAIQSGSDVDDPTLYPFYVMLGNPHVCGGVLLSLNPAIVLTAAHCVADAPHPFTIEKNPYFAAYSHIDRKKQKINAIDDWVVHPNYNISNNVDMHYDLALVKLKDPLEQSDRVDRVALWPADGRLLSFDGKLMGFGFLIKDGPEARRLQSIDVKVTKLASGLRDMVEAISADDEQRACHGDSGSPLIIRQSVNNATAPYALGLLARIFGVHDLDPDHATCPQPFKKNSKVPTITESFCNVSNMLDWISEITGISVANLTDPFYHVNDPCYESCAGRWTASKSHGSLDHTSDDHWHIGFGDESYLKEQPDKWFIGPVVQDKPMYHDNDETSFAICVEPAASIIFLFIVSCFIIV